MTDVVYIVRPGNENEELRYSLRSLANVPHGEVTLIGHCPPWVRNVRHVFAPQRDPSRFKYANTTASLRLLAEKGPDEFALFNDDFFCVRPVADMPRPATRGTLRALADERLADGRNSPYGVMLRDTAAILIEAGHSDPLAYTLHVPMVMNRDALAMTLEYGERHRAAAPALSWRSLYGNLMRLGGEWQPDVKVHGAGPVPPGPWVSTTDTSFRYHEVGRRLRHALCHPSPYEAL